MDWTMRSPCNECDHHLAGGGKSGRRCMNCDRRIAYLEYIGPMVASLGQGKKLNGHGGTDMPEIEEKTTELTEAEKTVHRICKKHGTDMETIISGRDNPSVNMKKLSHVIQEIVETLSLEMNMKNPAVAQILNMTPSAVWLRMEKYRKGKKTKTEPVKKPEKAANVTPPKTADPDNDKYLLEVNFKKHIAIYDDLIDLAKDKVRTPAGQIIFMLKQDYEKVQKVDKDVHT